MGRVVVTPSTIGSHYVPSDHGFVGSVGEFWNNLSGVTENREYNEFLQSKQNAYNSPSAQRARMIAAGFSDAAVSNYLLGESGSVGNQAAPAPREGSQGSGAAGLVSLLGSVLGLFQTVADTANTNADTANKEVEHENLFKVGEGLDIHNSIDRFQLDYVRDATPVLVRMLHDDASIKSAEKTMKEISARIATSTESSEVKRINAQNTELYVRALPFMEMTATELSNYCNSLLSKMLNDSQASAFAAESYRQLEEFKHEHIKNQKDLWLSDVNLRLDRNKVETIPLKKAIANSDFYGNMFYHIWQRDDAQAVADYEQSLFSTKFFKEANTKGVAPFVASWFDAAVAQWDSSKAQSDYLEKFYEWQKEHFKANTNSFYSILHNLLGAGGVAGATGAAVDISNVVRILMKLK